VDWKLVLAGLLVGALVGVTGMGGGSLMTPLLVFVFGFNPTVAIGTDIMHGAVFKSVGAIRHRRLGTVRARLAGWMFIGSAPMSLVGVWLADWIQDRYGDGTESLMATVLGAALLIGALGLVAKSFFRVQEHPERFRRRRRDRIAAVLIGLFGGLVVGLTSVGTGVFFGLSMLVLFPLRSSKVVGTDIFHAAALLWVAGFGHLVAGNVDLAAAGWLLIGSIPGVLLTSGLTLRMPDRALRLALAIVLALSGVKLVDLPGADVIVIAGLVAGALTLAVRFVLPALRRPATLPPARVRSEIP
jgi:uncharacterized membrane protein YfcA